MHFKLTSREIAGGVTTFFTMSYIIFVNPQILSTEGTGLPFAGVMTATIILCFSMTLLMGLYADLPFGIAPGMGINAFFTYQLILTQKIPWPVALGIVFWSGVVFVLTSITPLREKIATAIPLELRKATAAGIGIFISFIGLKNAGIIIDHPATLVTMGHLGTGSLLAMAGLLVMIFLMRRKSPFAFLVGIFGVTLAAWALGEIHTPSRFFSAPDFSTFFKLDIGGALKFTLLPAILALFFTDLFDSISTFMGVAHSAGMMDEKGNPIRLRQGLLVDAIATLTAGLFGSSSGTAYIESASGIEAGARTGTASLVTALCFLPCLFLAPLAGMIPPYATAPVLILVGAMMFRTISDIRSSELEIVVPSYLTLILIPLSFSITQGILWGLLSYVLLHWISGKGPKLSLSLQALGLLSLILLLLEYTSH